MIQNSNTKEPLSAATAKIIELNKTAIADSLGMVVFEKVPNGAYTLSISYVGCIDQTINITTPLISDTTLHVLMEEIEKTLFSIIKIIGRRNMAKKDENNINPPMPLSFKYFEIKYLST